MTQDVVFIAGTNRSGSSLLHLVIGAHPEYVAIGEAFGFIKPGSGRFADPEGVRCSCGKIATECSFWGKAVERLRQCNESTASGRYKVLLDAFKEHFGAHRSPVDSSKDVSAARALRDVPDAKVKVIYLIRDVRAWTVSIRKRHAQKKKDYPVYRRILGNFSTPVFWRWYRVNKRKQRDLRQLGVPWFQLGYEEFCLYPALSLRKISEFLDKPFADDVLSFNNAEHHAVLINPLRNDQQKLAGLFYDNRWFYTQRQWQLPMILFPNIMSYNKSQVYGRVGSPFK